MKEEVFCSSLWVMLFVTLEKCRHPSVASKMWEGQTSYLTLSLFIICVLTHWQPASPPFAPPFLDGVSSNMLACVCTGGGASNHTSVTTILPRCGCFPPLKGWFLAPYKRRRVCVFCQKGKQKPCVWCPAFDWGCSLCLTLPASWLSSHSHFLLHAARPPSSGCHSSSSVTAHTLRPRS